MRISSKANSVFWRIIVCLVLLSGTTTALAKNPYIPCVMCNGQGYWGFGNAYHVCVTCNGTGRIVDPYIAGATSMDLSFGKRLLSEGKYGESWKLFKKVVDAGLFSAHAFCGVYYELGLGVDPNRDVAWEYYITGANAGDSDCMAAVSRIRDTGWWPATDAKRKWFLSALKTQIEQNDAYVQQQYNNLQSGSNNFNNDNGSSVGNGKYKCAGCNGTGRCSLCAGRGEKRHSDGTAYDCTYCNGTGTCKICGGRGYTY